MVGCGWVKVGSNEVEDSFKHVPATPAVLQYHSTRMRAWALAVSPCHV